MYEAAVCILQAAAFFLQKRYFYNLNFSTRCWEKWVEKGEKHDIILTWRTIDKYFFQYALQKPERGMRREKKLDRVFPGAIHWRQAGRVKLCPFLLHNINFIRQYRKTLLWHGITCAIEAFFVIHGKSAASLVLHSEQQRYWRVNQVIWGGRG